jgi:hypothetical protein
MHGPIQSEISKNLKFEFMQALSQTPSEQKSNKIKSTICNSEPQCPSPTPCLSAPRPDERRPRKSPLVTTKCHGSLSFPLVTKLRHDTHILLYRTHAPSPVICASSQDGVERETTTRSPHASTASLSLPHHSTAPDDHRRHHSDFRTRPCLPSTMPATGASRRRRHNHAETAPAPTLATPMPGL